MAVLSIVLVGNGVHAHQEADVIALLPLRWPHIPLLGLFPSLETLSAQLLVVLGLACTALWTPHSAHAEDEAPVPAPEISWPLSAA